MRRTVLLLLLLLLPVLCGAATRYMAPAGNDSSAGTQAAPWKTFPSALPRLAAGDTLLLLPGTYTVPANGAFTVGCSGSQYPTGAADGTAAAPITVKAQPERQALLQGDGKNVVALDGCSYWRLEGLYVRNTDVQRDGWEGSGIVLTGSDHLTVRRALVYGPNAWFNSHGIALYGTRDSLLEENEIYYVARHGVILGDGGGPVAGNTVRRNYVHSRDHADMPGGYVSAPGCGTGTTRGDEGISCYPCKNTLFENNIIEHFDSSFTIQCKQDCGKNRYAGNISLGNGCGGIGFTARGEMFPSSATQMPTDETVVHHLTVGSTVSGGGCTSCKNLVVDHMTIVGNPKGFKVKLGSSQYGEQGDGVSTFTGTHMLIAHNAGVGFEALDQATWSLSHSLLFGNPGGTTPALSGPGYTNILTSDPQLGACLVFIPPGSPAKGAGLGGADMGATILARYQDGVLTSTPLWQPGTGQFPCGAVVPGVNDVAGASCVNVHERLHVGTASCPLPSLTPGTVLTWQPPLTGSAPTTYAVTRDGAVLGAVPAATLTYTDQAPGPACYRVTAQNAYGETPSPAVCVHPGTPPGAVEDLTVTPPAIRRRR